MEFGFGTPPQISNVHPVRLAEDLGFSHWWAFEGHMLWSDPYAFLTLAATATSSIKLGVGVTNPLTRIPPVTANSIATINALAPGRTVLGFGTGHNALRSMGMRPARMEEIRTGLAVCRALLGGESTEFVLDGRRRLIEFLNVDNRSFNVSDRIPLYMAAGGPQMLQLAGEIADGVQICAASPEVLRIATRYVHQGAERAGRDPSKIDIVAVGWYYNRQPSDSLEDVIRNGVGSGPISGAVVNAGLIIQHRDEFDAEFVFDVEAAVNGYLIQGGDPKTRHLDAWRHYVDGLQPGHEALVTQRLIDAFAIVGNSEQCVNQLKQLESAGARQYFFEVSDPKWTNRDIEAFGRNVIDKY